MIKRYVHIMRARVHVHVNCARADPESETRSGNVYVPRDEAFSEVKNVQFSVKTLQSVLQAAVPAVQSTLIDPNQGFPSFFVIDKLFEDGVELPRAQELGFLRSVVPRLLECLRDGPGDKLLLFDTPANVQSTYVRSYVNYMRLGSN
jgi:lipoxygenase